ncbi:MAG: peptidoglycan-binding protein [Alphaproteobacteria bacterium]|nr:peptidoglycan-binding protein [Alphaproteobacteria bacterium]
MRRFALAGLVAAALAGLGGPALAADQAGSFAVDGIGTWSCSKYIEERAKESNYYFMFGGWVDGYLTAINAYSPDSYDLTPWETTGLLMALIERNCKERPDEQFVGMVVAMAKKLKETRLAAPSPVIEASANGQSVKLYQDTMMKVQQALVDAGFYSGTVDGQFGPMSQSAIEAFQSARQLQVTGLPDQLTLVALLRPAQPAAE